MASADLLAAAGSLAAGRYAIGVSGGADSVALLHLLHHARPDVALHVVHLDHQTRGAESTGDAAFVQELAGRWGLVCTVARRDEIERDMGRLPANASARYRAARFELYRRVVKAEDLRGVILAHHADDQAETVLHRLLRGTRAPNLRGMAAQTQVGGMLVLRPLLAVPGGALREYLVSVNQPWREDASNASLDYLRNRLRRVLRGRPDMTAALLELHEAMSELRRWVGEAAPRLGEQFASRQVADLPSMVAGEALRRWLVERGAEAHDLGPAVIERLMEMARDAASPPRAQFPGGLLVRRRGGRISAERPGEEG